MIYIYKASLIRVVDGDTVDLMIDLGFDTSRKERFRLYGIDAPEMNTLAGKAAKAWLIEAIQPLGTVYVQTIQLETKAKRDKYGRYMAKSQAISRCSNLHLTNPMRLVHLGKGACYLD